MAIHKSRDVSNALIDFPHIPRALLEMIDFYGCLNVYRPYIKEGKRDDFFAYMALVGAEVAEAPESDGVLVILDPLNSELLVGVRKVYLTDLNRFFRRVLTDD